MSSDTKPIVLGAPYSVYVELCAWRSGKTASGRMVDRLSTHPSFGLTRVPPRHATSSLWAVPPARCESRADRVCDIVTDGMPHAFDPLPGLRRIIHIDMDAFYASVLKSGLAAEGNRARCVKATASEEFADGALPVDRDPRSAFHRPS
jgi:hypothetical protein